MATRPTQEQATRSYNRDLYRQRLVCLRDSYLEQSTNYLRAYAVLLGAVDKFDSRIIDEEEAERLLDEARQYLGPSVEEVL